MDPRDEHDRPLPANDPFHQELRLLLAERVDPATRPGPRGNPPVDRHAVARIARMMQTIVG